jgi:hypothetical protein
MLSTGSANAIRVSGNPKSGTSDYRALQHLAGREIYSSRFPDSVTGETNGFQRNPHI